MDLGAPLHLVLGDEELLVSRAVDAVVAHAVAADPATDVRRLRAGEVTAPELAELLSPSLFADARVVVLEAAHEAGKDPAALVVDAAADLPPGITLVVVHAGGKRGAAIAEAVRRAGAVVHRCEKLGRGERLDFVRGELRRAGATTDREAAQAVLDTVGNDLRELAAACSQLAADTGGRVDEAAVRRYHRGLAEVSGFDVADAAMTGTRGHALETLRWATDAGVPHVLLADALAESVRVLARVGTARGNPNQLAGRLGIAPFKISKAMEQSRLWDLAALPAALQVVATLNADVKGGAADADYAVERAVLAVVALRDGRRH
ncbi:DNA polymerase III subunit delta [Rhodococcus aerolatus]